MIFGYRPSWPNIYVGQYLIKFFRTWWQSIVYLRYWNSMTDSIGYHLALKRAFDSDNTTVMIDSCNHGPLCPCEILKLFRDLSNPQAIGQSSHWNLVICQT